MPEAGQTAPDFPLPVTGGAAFAGLSGATELRLSALRGHKVVLYFYPRDDTPGCTTEALDFTRLAPEFAAAGAVVIGISKDSLARHDRFCARHGLGVALASDAEGRVCEDYGAWGTKQMYGKTHEGIIRSSVLIDAAGLVARHWPKVSVRGHAEEVLEAVRALG